ncbi:NOT2 family protein [Blastomyces gilchristii SLH14081]|uniref:NOT2 family protein n=2 Tax=Blastomyces gilchristii (strain SLH14081) TaxID=559298 RepID=A0A179UVW7_BLAGS|nr:NOT2 family protein [Blastomyces gilchristii SLH14081]OAT11943.1 NOT2 family protein [Blastomyces gilchristii SLH14081]
MNRPGPGQQPLRGMSGFPAQQQQQPQTRPTNPSLVSTRLPNGKIGTAANWGFGLPMGGAPGLQSNQQRTVNAMNSFAQSISGSQPATPLDLSEFPSLSSVPQQSQPSASGQVTWANASQRVNQQSAIQRQSQTPATSQPPSRVSQTQALSHQPPSQSHASHEDLFPSATQFAAQLDDFRNGGQGISGQLSGGTQPQTGNIDEFPPLGRNGPADIGQERRASLLQSRAFGNYGGGMAFPNLNQSHSGQGRTLLGNMVNGQQDGRIMSPGAGGSGVMSTSRSPMGQVQNGGLSQEKDDLGASSMQRTIRPEAYPEQQSQPIMQQPPQNRQQKSGNFGDEGQEQSQQGQSSEQAPLTQLSDRDRFGLQGLLSMIRSENPDVATLAVGQDLMTLGLDLNQPEPLHPSFASPFISSNAAVPLQVDFTLPACYNVANVQPLQTRIPSFSDETLFYIFYSMPRDVMQELVAEELMSRKWRYHKVERAWLTRDEAYIVEMERGLSERGIYIFWDTTTWKKIRREFVLRYADLDNHLDRRGYAQGVAFPQNT